SWQWTTGYGEGPRPDSTSGPSGSRPPGWWNARGASLNAGEADRPLDGRRGELRVERVALHQRPGALEQRVPFGLEASRERRRDHPRDLPHVVLDQAAGRERRRADPEARGIHGRALVEGDRVPVHGDPDLLEAGLGGLAVEPGGPEVDQHEVDVGATGEHRDPAGHQLLGQRLGVGDRLALAGPERLRG